MSGPKLQKTVDILTALGLVFLVSSFLYDLFKVILYKSIPIQKFLVSELGNLLTILFLAAIVATSFGKSAKARSQAIERMKAEQALGAYKDFPSAWYWLYLLSAAGISTFLAFELADLPPFRSYPPINIFFTLLVLFFALGAVLLSYASKHSLARREKS